MQAMQAVEWLDTPLVEARENPELERWIQEHSPSPLPVSTFLADCPWMLRADVYLDETYVHITEIAPLIYLTVSRDNSCRFCYGAARFLLRLDGKSDAEIERIENDVETAVADPRLQLALDYARRVSRANPPPGAADRQALRDVGYDDLAIREIAFHATDVLFHNRMYTLLAVPLFDHGLLQDRGMFATLREQFSRLLAVIAAPSKAEKLADELKTGPFSNVVVALDGLHQARFLRKILDEAWESPHLPTRTKVLIFAVIARGLGSQAAEAEAYRLLADEGLAEDRVDAILAHLSAPELDEIETRILPYVRETVWYQTPVAQRRGRELREHLSSEQFLETVGIAALANMVCRLPLVLDAG